MNNERTVPGNAARAEPIRPGRAAKNATADEMNEEIAARVVLNALVNAEPIADPSEASADTICPGSFVKT